MAEADGGGNEERKKEVEGREEKEKSAKEEVWHPPYQELEAPSSIVPRSIFADIWSENKQFLREKHLFSEPFGRFLLKISKGKSAAGNLDLVKIVFR